MRTTTSFHKEKNIKYTNIYDTNECPVFKKASTRNILGTMFRYSKNLIIITIYNFLFKVFLYHKLYLYSRFINIILYEY